MTNIEIAKQILEMVNLEKTNINFFFINYDNKNNESSQNDLMIISDNVVESKNLDNTEEVKETVIEDNNYKDKNYTVNELRHIFYDELENLYDYLHSNNYIRFKNDLSNKIFNRNGVFGVANRKSEENTLPVKHLNMVVNWFNKPNINFRKKNIDDLNRFKNLFNELQSIYKQFKEENKGNLRTDNQKIEQNIEQPALFEVENKISDKEKERALKRFEYPSDLNAYAIWMFNCARLMIQNDIRYSVKDVYDILDFSSRGYLKTICLHNSRPEPQTMERVYKSLINNNIIKSKLKDNVDYKNLVKIGKGLIEKRKEEMELERQNKSVTYNMGVKNKEKNISKNNDIITSIEKLEKTNNEIKGKQSILKYLNPFMNRQNVKTVTSLEIK